MKTRISNMPKSARRWLARAIGGPALLATLLLGLLLIQPTLCIIHCALDAHLHDDDSTSDYKHLLCSLTDSETAQSAHVPLPAFWPSLPASPLVTILLVALIQAQLPLAPARLRSLHWSPPSPPPRLIADSR